MSRSSAPSNALAGTDFDVVDRLRDARLQLLDRLFGVFELRRFDAGRGARRRSSPCRTRSAPACERQHVGREARVRQARSDRTSSLRRTPAPLSSSSRSGCSVVRRWSTAIVCMEISCGNPVGLRTKVGSRGRMPRREGARILLRQAGACASRVKQCRRHVHALGPRIEPVLGTRAARRPRQGRRPERILRRRPHPRRAQGRRQPRGRGSGEGPRRARARTHHAPHLADAGRPAHLSAREARGGGIRRRAGAHREAAHPGHRAVARRRGSDLRPCAARAARAALSGKLSGCAAGCVAARDRRRRTWDVAIRAGLPADEPLSHRLLGALPAVLCATPQYLRRAARRRSPKTCASTISSRPSPIGRTCSSSSSRATRSGPKCASCRSSP